jgi:hypothetical protein
VRHFQTSKVQLVMINDAVDKCDVITVDNNLSHDALLSLNIASVAVDKSTDNTFSSLDSAPLDDSAWQFFHKALACL